MVLRRWMAIFSWWQYYFNEGKSLLNRMNYIILKVSVLMLVKFHCQILSFFWLIYVCAEVLMNDIPDQLIINWDHTGLYLLPAGQSTMHRAGEKANVCR